MNHPDFTRRVFEFLRDGFGVEDIAVKMKFPVNVIRNEVQILREEGRLESLRGGTRWGKTALRLMAEPEVLHEVGE